MPGSLPYYIYVLFELCRQVQDACKVMGRIRIPLALAPARRRQPPPLCSHLPPRPGPPVCRRRGQPAGCVVHRRHRARDSDAHVRGASPRDRQNTGASRVSADVDVPVFTVPPHQSDFHFTVRAVGRTGRRTNPSPPVRLFDTVIRHSCFFVK